MHDAVKRMLAKYEPKSVDDSVRALREIIQEVALLGLWRAKFFEHAAFYGGTALRILYGLDRFSEDLDFSLLEPSADFNLARFTASLEEELLAFGFNVRVEMVDKAVESAVQSAFLKANTRNELLVIEAGEELAGQISAGQVLKVKIELDTDPPAGFTTSTRYLLQPIPFAVRSYSLPDLFAGKMHALLFRKWKNRVKGVTGMILSGMPPIILSCTSPILSSVCARLAIGVGRNLCRPRLSETSCSIPLTGSM